MESQERHMQLISGGAHNTMQSHGCGGRRCPFHQRTRQPANMSCFRTISSILKRTTTGLCTSMSRQWTSVLWSILVLSHVTLRFGVSAQELDELRCVWRSSISSTLPQEQEASPRSQCTLGQLWWYYPRGSLAATFRHESHTLPFTLCLHDDGQQGSDCSMRHFRFYNTTMQDTQRTALNTPTPGVPVCLPSVNGRVMVNTEALSSASQCRLLIITYHRQPP